MKTFKTTLLKAAAICSGLTIAITSHAQGSEDLDLILRSIHDGPIAKVNDVPIPREDFTSLYQSHLATQRQISGGEISDAERVRLAFFCLITVVEQEILLQEAKKRGLTVSESRVQEVLSRTLDGIREAQRNKDLSDEEVLAIAGATKEDAMAEIRDTLLMEETRKAIAIDRGVKVNDQEVNDRYNERPQRFQRPEGIHIKQIYFRVSRNAAGEVNEAERERARQRAQECLGRLQQGVTFEGVARNTSEVPPELRENGGDMGPMAVNDLPPVIVQAAKQLEPGEVSGVVESPFGFHIIKLVEFIDSDTPDMEVVRKIIRAEIFSEKASTAVRGFIQDSIESGTYAYQDYLDLEYQLRNRPDLLEQLSADIPEND